MKKIICLLAVIACIVAIVFFIRKNTGQDSEVVLIDNAIEFDLSGEKSLENYLFKNADIEIEGKYNEKSEYITLVISAPDMYEYITQNENKLSEYDPDLLYDVIVSDIESNNIQKTKAYLDIPVRHEGKKIIAEINNDNYDYINAVFGRLPEKMRDYKTEIINNSFRYMEEQNENTQ